MRYLAGMGLARLASAFVITAALSACNSGGSNGGSNDPDPVPDGGGDGGGTTGFTVGGTISGNDGSVTLSLNGVEETFSGASFIFADTLESNEVYGVAFVLASGDQLCSVANASGTIAANITNIAVTCAAPVNTLSYDDANIDGGLAVGDFNGDNFTDIAFSIVTRDTHMTGSGNNMMRFVFGNGAGLFENYSDVALLGSVSHANNRAHMSVTQDFNGDSNDDYVISTNALQLFQGSPDNIPTTSSITTDYAGVPIYSADIDKDGDMDIITARTGGNSYPYVFDLHRNQGDGTFTAEGIINRFSDPDVAFKISDSAINMTMADFNGDGNVDILSVFTTVGSGGGEMILVTFSGNGDGTFDFASKQDLSPDLYADLFFTPTTSSDSKEIAFGDFDEDGDLDIAITSHSNYLQIMLNDGSAVFSDGQRVTVGTTPIHLHAADFNNDSILDLYTINMDSKNGILSLGLGDGTFGSNTGSAENTRLIQYPSYVEMQELIVTDLDLDGYLDALIFSWADNRSSDRVGSVEISYGVGK